MTKPFVSVVIPARDAEQTLADCLDSVLAQTYPNFEVVVVNNVSSDATSEILELYAQKCSRVKVMQEAILGRGRARNIGIGIAKGSIILMTDADCTIPPNWLEIMTQPILEGREVVVQGKTARRGNSFWVSMQNNFNREFYQYSLSQRRYLNQINTKNLALKKSVLLEVGVFDSEFHNMEDFELKIRLQQSGHRIYFGKQSEVIHLQLISAGFAFWKRVDQGYWATEAFFKHKPYLETHPEPLTSAFSLKNAALFIPWLLGLLLRGQLKKFYFEAVIGFGWRVGIGLNLAHRFSKRIFPEVD